MRLDDQCDEMFAIHQAQRLFALPVPAIQVSSARVLTARLGRQRRNLMLRSGLVSCFAPKPNTRTSRSSTKAPVSTFAHLLKMGSTVFRVQNKTRTYLYGQSCSEYPIFLRECTSDGWHYFQNLSAACCYEWNEIGEVLRRLIRNAAITMHVD